MLESGRIVEGRLMKVKTEDGRKVIEFVAYNRTKKRRAKDRLIRELEHGWVKESHERIKVYESIPKRIGTVRVCMALEREVKEAQQALRMEEVMKW